MKILNGLLPGQVLRRDKKNNAAVRISGAAKAEGVVECQIRKGRGRAAKALRGFDWKPVGKADGQEFAASIDKIPAGGPYSISLRICGGKKVLDSVSIDEFYVGDVWFMGGQSNMHGVGNMTGAPKPHPMVRAFYMRDEWTVADEPINFVAESLDKAHNGYGVGPKRPSDNDIEKMRSQTVKGRGKGVSPGVHFAQEMRRRTGVPQGLVPCALGGSRMAQWSPELRAKGGESLYGAMMRRFEKLGQPVSGILWYQGESDCNEGDAAKYTERMKDLVASVRRDMGQPRLPWLMVQIGQHVEKFCKTWNEVQEQERLLPGLIPDLEVVPSVDLEIDDPIHISGAGQGILGKRLARVAERLALGNTKRKPAITYAGCEVIKVGALNDTTVRLKYKNVVGGLRSEGRPNGFTLHDASGALIERGVYKVTLEKDSIVLGVWPPLRSLSGSSISYGYGMYPYCNITDGEGMGLPVMLRQPLGVEPFMPFALNWQYSRIRSQGGLKGVSLEEALKRSGWKSCGIAADFVALACPFDGKDRTGVYAMKTSARSSEAMNAELRFGSDSPFILWLNGKKTIEDLAATNPVTPDEYKKVVKLSKGVNEIVIAFDTRGDVGWGVCMAFEPLPGKPSLVGKVEY